MGLELCDKAATLVASPQVLIFLCVFENVEAVEMMQRGLGLRRGREPSRRRHDARANGAAAAQSHLTRHRRSGQHTTHHGQTARPPAQGTSSHFARGWRLTTLRNKRGRPLLVHSIDSDGPV